MEDLSRSDFVCDGGVFECGVYVAVYAVYDLSDCVPAEEGMELGGWRIAAYWDGDWCCDGWGVDILELGEREEEAGGWSSKQTGGQVDRSNGWGCVVSGMFLWIFVDV